MRGVILDKYQNLLQPVPNAGLPALRQAIADELYRQRGMEVLPEQILIGAGAEYFYNLILQFLGRDRLYGLEELGHRKIARIYEANGVAIAPIAMDGEGIRVDALEKSGASVVHLSPSHHYPTGIVTPIGRRQALMAPDAPGRFPYPFLNYERLGVGRMLLIVAVMTALFLALGCFYRRLDCKLAEPRRGEK